MSKFSLLIFSLFTFLLISACSSDSDTSLYEAAKIKIEQENYLEAMNDYQKILKDFPDSKLALAAKFEIGKMYQGNVVPKIAKQESIKEAIKIYREIVDTYPDSIQAINSLFMIAFLEANEIHNLEKARATYEEFLQKYPSHELAYSAKAELMNLGKTPEEILQEKIKESK